MSDNKKKIPKSLDWFLFAVAVILVYKTLDNFSAIGSWIKNLFDVLMPFIVGLLIAYLLYIPCRKIEAFYKKNKKIKFIVVLKLEILLYFGMEIDLVMQNL